MTTTTNAGGQPSLALDEHTGSNDRLPEVPPPDSLAAAPDPLKASGLIPHPSTLNSQPDLHRLPGETPRAFSAFVTWFQLGHSRCLAAVAGQLGEKPDTVKFWSSKYRWSDRLMKTVQLGLPGGFRWIRVYSGVAAPSQTGEGRVGIAML